MTVRLPRSRRWIDLPTSAFSEDVLRGVIAVLPLGAVEQHGPHLPVGTDTAIADGMVAAVAARLAEEAPVLFLPSLAIGNSTEHTDAPGTLTVSRETLVAQIMAIADGVCRAGVRKLVIVNAHGGNVGVMVDASHAIRAELGLLCVATNWMRLGLPDGVIAPQQRGADIHAGQLETALMLALAANTVDMSAAQSFPNLQSELGERFELLRAYGPIGFGWMGSDLNPSGAVGDASAASADQGRAIIDHQADQMVRLLAEIAAFDPPWFAA
ncbi:MAG: creatininase family protein [Devosiaceae bacterium]|nr:creatininase family protein [Devosiaceae bacterium MH13]